MCAVAAGTAVPLACCSMPLRLPDPLPPERLRWRCDPRELDFSSTLDVAPLEGTVGQERGVSAVAFALGLDNRDGFNVYVAGQPGSGRTTTVSSLVLREAA